RDKLVTGVQTCALPILSHTGPSCSRSPHLYDVKVPNEISSLERMGENDDCVRDKLLHSSSQRLRSERFFGNEYGSHSAQPSHSRSEERRVGKEERAWEK